MESSQRTKCWTLCLTNFKAVTAEQETERRDARHLGQFNHPRCGSGRKRSALRPRDQGTPLQDWPHARPGSGGGPALGQGRRGPRPGETVQARQGSALAATLLLINLQEAAARQPSLGKVCKTQTEAARAH